MATFTETQRFRQWWVWLVLVGFPFGLAIMVLFSTNRAEHVQNWLLPFFFALPGILLIFFWRLDTRLDNLGIHYCMFPFIRWRTILWTDVAKVYVRQYDFVGYGVRWDFTTWYYNVNGNQGLQINKKSGRQHSPWYATPR